MNILIVDDDADVCDSLENLLMEEEFESCTITIRKSGKAAIETLEENNFDITICDVKMANGDGYYLLNEISHMDVGPMQTIMMTGYTALEKKELLELGAYAVVNKPFRIDEILKVIDAALSKKKEAS